MSRWAGLGMVALLLTGCTDGLCQCTEPEVVVVVQDSLSGAPVANVTVSSTPSVAFFCTEGASETRCVGSNPPFGPITLFVSAPDYADQTFQGDVAEPVPDAACDCGGLSVLVPLDPR